MVALHHPAVGLRLAGFDDLPFVAGVIKLKAVLVAEEEGLSPRAGGGSYTHFTLPPGRPGGAGDEVARERQLTGFRGSSTSLMLRFSSGMIPLGSLSYERRAHSQPPVGQRSKAPLTRGPGDPPLTHRRVLEVVETVVGQDEPPALPGLHSAP